MEKTTLPRGLTLSEVAAKLRQDGYNELPSQKKQSLWDIFLNVMKEPMLLLLVGSGGVYLFLGETRDALMLLTFVFVVIGITFYQERKTERALEALKSLSSPRALVIREGVEQRIPGRELVEGDIIVLREGDRIPADGVVLSSSHLQVDESLLTGESLPVRKVEWDGKIVLKQPGGEDAPFIFSGTMVVQGHSIARITKTGGRSEMGKIGRELQSIEEEDTLLKKETAAIVKKFAAVGIILCVLVILLIGITRGHWLEGFLSGLTLSMAMLPEEFGVVLVIFMALGAWRMSKHKVLARKTAAIETLGSATVLCVDKTGTITLNKMRLDTLQNSQGQLFKISRDHAILPEEFHEVLEYAVLASQKDPFDPIETEIKYRGDQFLAKTEHLHHTWNLLKEYPLSRCLLALSHVWRSPDKTSYVIAAKGAPEAIIDLCHLTAAETKAIMEQVHLLANQGLRILGIARGEFKNGNLPHEQHDFDFSFVGLVSFADPIRAAVPGAVQEAYGAGIRTIMITGDYPGTASHIAAQIGLHDPDRVVTGEELRLMPHAELREKIRTVNVFARVVPDQKLALVNALKANGEVVAMTGDGVNDAPALKSAHIGIAMGERGTDVAREAADLVLLNDDFTSIVRAVRMGRRIYENLRKAMSYILAVHVPIAGMSFLPVLFQLPIVLFPAQIAFLELIIDPACSVVFESEPEDHDIMKRPPRNLKSPLLSRNAYLASFMQGIVVLVITLLVFMYTLLLHRGDVEARTLAFTILVIGNLMLILTNLSWEDSLFRVLGKKNTALRVVGVGALTALGLILYVPFLRNLFHFSFMHPHDLFMALAAGVISIAWFELVKLWRRKQSAG